MRRSIRWSLVATAAFMLVAGAVPATADHSNRVIEDLQPLGHSPHPATFFGATDIERNINSDLAFWGDLAFNGNYDGFRIIDISDPANPQELLWQHCNGDQGDIVVYQDILVRSWNSPKPEDRQCDGETVPAGWEGVHVFDISNLEDPDLVAAVELPCGSHTATLAGLVDRNLIVYSNNSSSSGCVDGTRANDDPVGDFMDVIQIPLADPSQASLLRREELAGPTTDVRTGCHDAGVILGSENKAACASADTINVWDIGENETPGGSITDPELLYTIYVPGVADASTNGRWHTAAFTWDGEVLSAGWEPGGGAAPECEAEDPPEKKSKFFFDADTGELLGLWTLPRPQSSEENCTIHNWNVLPMRDGRYIAVGGHYQAGTWVVDFTDPANAQTVAFADPPPLGTVTTPGGATVNELGGAWSSYGYNRAIYESEITKGLNVFRLLDRGIVRNWINLRNLNPQTSPFSFEAT
ncbi:MAG TPA: hypothetical protein VHL78_09655 [Actinomycetota bacterium]|nr:hypothetical protein [Actinomycetota bacterium]